MVRIDDATPCCDEWMRPVTITSTGAAVPEVRSSTRAARPRIAGGNRSQGSDLASPKQLGLWVGALTDVSAGERCRSERRDAGWSQTQLATEIGMSQSSLSRAEAGLRVLSVDEVVAIGRALEITPQRLLGQTARAFRRRPLRNCDAGWITSRALASRLPVDMYSEFSSRGGSIKAVHEATQGRAPLPAGQALILQMLLNDHGVVVAALT